MERGEYVVFGVNIMMLVALVFFLNLGTPSSSGTSQGISSIDTAFWGSPSLNQGIPYAKTLVTPSNESLVYVPFSLGQGVTVSAASASRVCQSQLSSVGVIRNYGNLTFEAGSSSNKYYLVISPSTQALGWQCTYTATISVTSKADFQWTGTVIVQR